jgi:hypothetical protein
VAVAHVRSDTLTGDPYTTLLDSTPVRLRSSLSMGDEATDVG